MGRSMYLLYEHEPSSEWTHTLCRIELGDGSKFPDAADRQVVTPILETRNNGKNAREMRCACLGSNLYMLGGVIDKKIFPREVRVLDLKTHQWHTLNSKLNSGKPCPIVFAANGKLYALADLSAANSLRYPNDVYVSIKTALSKLNLFECYDPETDEWRVLDDPPINRFTEWSGCSVLIKHRKVVLYGNDKRQAQMSNRGNVQLVFDLDKDKWAPEPNPVVTNNIHSMDLESWEEGDDLSVYGIDTLTGLPTKSKFNSPSHPHPHDAWIRMRMDDNDELWNPRRVPIPYDCLPAKLLRYAGDKYFYYIVSAPPPHPIGYDPYGYLSTDADSLFIDVVLFKELGGRHFTTKAIFRQSFEIKSPDCGMADLINCHLIEVPNAVVDDKNSRQVHTTPARSSYGLGWPRKFCYGVGSLIMQTSLVRYCCLLYNTWWW